MKRTFPLIVFLVFSMGISCVAQEKQPIDYVDVFIGTSNSRWMNGPIGSRHDYEP